MNDGPSIPGLTPLQLHMLATERFTLDETTPPEVFAAAVDLCRKQLLACSEHGSELHCHVMVMD